MLGITLEEFDQDFEQRMLEHVKEWGRDPSSSTAYRHATVAGDRAMRSKDWAAAVDAFETARSIRPYDELPIRRLAGLYLVPDIDRPLDAAALLLELHERTQGDNRFAKRAARIYLDNDDPAAAVEAATAAVHMGTYDVAAHELLRRAAEAAGDEALAKQQAERIEALR